MDLFSKIPAQVRIVEVGPRDGLQNEKQPLNAEDRIELIKRLSDAGMVSIEAGSFVSPKWVPQMADTDKVLIASSYLPADLPVLVPNERGLEQAIVANAKEIAVFTATSEAFVKKNINCTVEESLERIALITKKALSLGMKVRGYVSTVMDCPYEGVQSPERCAEISKILLDLGCYEISLGDTIGRGTPIRTAELLTIVMKQVPQEKLAVHFHDTWGQALPNILVALQMGITVVDSSIGGLGGCPYAKGASGNVATEDVLYMMQQMGIKTGIDLDKVVDIARWVAQKLGKNLPGHVHHAAG